MNIFVLHEEPTLAAMYHCDKHVVKMILETAQILSTAHRILDGNEDEILYKRTHVHHPCTKWAMSSSGNYEWLYNLFVELCKEYTHRYNKTHKTETRLLNFLRNHPKNIKSGILERFAICMGTNPECINDEDPVGSYREFYMKKDIVMKWKKREVPHWYKD